MQKPKGKKVLVTYGYDDKTWYEAEVKSLLSVQFTAEIDYKDSSRGYRLQRFGFYMYKDFNYTWKEIEKWGTSKRCESLKEMQ